MLLSHTTRYYILVKLLNKHEVTPNFTFAFLVKGCVFGGGGKETSLAKLSPFLPSINKQIQRKRYQSQCYILIYIIILQF